MGRGTRTHFSTASWCRWVMISTVLATVLLLLANSSHGAVIKRESSVTGQELAAEELLAPSPASKANETAAAAVEKDALRDANRISETIDATSETKAQKSKFDVEDDEGVEEDGDSTPEPFDAADEVSATDTPIPTFPPFDINRYTSKYRDDGVVESESLRETSDGGAYTTVDYAQQFDRIELTTPPSSGEFSGPSGMFKQESSRFDAGSLEQTNNNEEEEENETATTIVNLDGIKENSTAERNTSSYFNNVELETTKYEIQADEAKVEGMNGSAVVAVNSTGQKRGKYLQNPEEATIINSETNEPNLSIPSTADVWALATMKNVDHTKKKAGFYYNETAERNSEKNAPVNGTSSTKLLTDWMEIMKNGEFSNQSVLGNDIPSVGQRPGGAPVAMEERMAENKNVEVAVAPPSLSTTTTSARRFDEFEMDTTTEGNNYHRATGDFEFPSGSGGRVSDNLYYEDFTTDLPDFFTTTSRPTAEAKDKGEYVNKVDQPTVMTATTEPIPGNELNTVPNEQSYDRKSTEGLNNLVAPSSPLENTSPFENYIPITTEGEEEAAVATSEVKGTENESNGNLHNSLTTTPPTVTVEVTTVPTTDDLPRVIPLVDAEMKPTTEKKEQEQNIRNKEEEREDEIVQIIVQPSTLNPTSASDITNNSIERQTETKLAESNQLPEYTIVEHTSTGSDLIAGDGGDATASHNNNNSNYLENSNSNSNNNDGGRGEGSQSSAAFPTTTSTAAAADHGEDDRQQLAHELYTRPTETAESTPVPVSNVRTKTTTSSSSSTNKNAGVANVESGGAVSHEQSKASETMTTTTTKTDVSSSPTVADQTTAPVATAIVPETMATKTTTTTLSPERIEVEQHRTNGHQVIIDGRHNLEHSANGSLELGNITGGGEQTAPTDGHDVNAIIAITVSVVAVIALVLLVGFLYVMRKRQKQLSYGQRCQPVGLDAYSLDNVSVYNSVRRKNNNLRLSKRSYGNSAFEDPGLKFNNLSIQGLQTMINNKDDIYEEFKEIPLVTARVDEVPAGCEDKNRYANVVPLPETRVHLKQLNGDEKTEYINASYVRGPKDNTNYYIASQAPMENTIVDFWRMIWEQNSKVICMLTDLTENGIEKCAEYLPPSAVLDTNRVFGDYSVTLKNREVKDKYAVSTIHLRNTETNTWREITHFWYQWPEEGMPLDETSVIAMLLEVRSYLKMAMPEQEGGSDDEILTTKDTTDDDKQKQIQELNDDLTEKLEEDSVTTEKKVNGNGTMTIDKSKSLQRSQGPLTVHCSPGTGRTGTIIACDIALRSLEMKNRSVDVAQTVYYVRRGRASSIKTRDQYEFVYRCANTYAQKLMEPIPEN